MCSLQEFSPENYGAKFREAVDILHANVPRLIVQLIVMFDVTPLANLSTGLLCNALQVYVKLTLCLFNNLKFMMVALT